MGLDLMVRKIVVQANSLEANPLRPIEMTAEIGHCRTILHEFWNSGHKDYYLDYEWDFYGEITTTDPDQITNLEKWFRSHRAITEDQLLGRTALLGGSKDLEGEYEHECTTVGSRCPGCKL